MASTNQPVGSQRAADRFGGTATGPSIDGAAWVAPASVPSGVSARQNLSKSDGCLVISGPMAIDNAEERAAAPVTGCPVLAGYDPLSRPELVDPFPSYERARHEAPVFYSEDYGFWSVSRREDVLSILRDT